MPSRSSFTPDVTGTFSYECGSKLLDQCFSWIIKFSNASTLQVKTFLDSSIAACDQYIRVKVGCVLFLPFILEIQKHKKHSHMICNYFCFHRSWYKILLMHDHVFILKYAEYLWGGLQERHSAFCHEYLCEKILDKLKTTCYKGIPIWTTPNTQILLSCFWISTSESKRENYPILFAYRTMSKCGFASFLSWAKSN